MAEQSIAGRLRSFVTHHDGRAIYPSPDISQRRMILKAADELDRLTKERDEADRAAGAAARRIAGLEDTEIKRNRWLREAKQAAGYTDNTSFDVIWAEALAALKEKRAALNKDTTNG